MIMNEYEENMIEFSYNLQHGIFLFTCNLHSKGEA
jgi:hypothetical protein